MDKEWMHAKKRLYRTLQCPLETPLTRYRFLVRKIAQTKVIDFNAVSERVCMLRCKDKFFIYSIINAHAPTEEADELTKDL
ncbi:unnamed protein product [Pieris brassicae]|uniref:Uncharacterized protein n=1 Tax=Pieris brassicae TaxID=7116 RepID=A0A9P0XGF2_PIEBR|nr:unnamed protein product [Pieris brassicae]